MEVEILKEEGYSIALRGLSLSRGHEQDYLSGKKDMVPVALKLAPMDGGHNKYLESIIVWIRIRAPRYFWTEFDTYRVGTSKQSESSIDLITKRQLTRADFEGPVDMRAIDIVNEKIVRGEWLAAKKHLPEAYLQTRIVCTNYKVLRNIVSQRTGHRLKEWAILLEALYRNLKNPELLPFQSRGEFDG